MNVGVFPGHAPLASPDVFERRKVGRNRPNDHEDGEDSELDEGCLFETTSDGNAASQLVEMPVSQVSQRSAISTRWTDICASLDCIVDVEIDMFGCRGGKVLL